MNSSNNAGGESGDLHALPAPLARSLRFENIDPEGHLVDSRQYPYTKMLQTAAKCARCHANYLVKHPSEMGVTRETAMRRYIDEGSRVTCQHLLRGFQP